MSRLRQLVESWLRGEVKLAPIAELLDVKPVEVGEGFAKLELHAGARLHNAMGTVHGGIFCDLADVAMGAALATVVEEGESFTTLQLQTSFLRAVREDRLEAAARVVRRGRGTAYLECEIHNGEGQLAAKVTSVYMIRQVRNRD